MKVVELFVFPASLLAIFVLAAKARTCRQFLGGYFLIVLLALGLLTLTGCMFLPHTPGGNTTTTLGGMTAPTTVANHAPRDPSTPSTTTVEKTTERVYELPPTPTTPDGSQGVSAREQPETSPRSAAAQIEPRVATATVQGASPVTNVSRAGAAAPRQLLRETVSEKATTSTGTAQKDTARELGARLTNMRGVMWVGIFLLIAGPLVGWRMGWFTNGCIAGAVGLLLIILAQVIPGNEAWFGLIGLLILPLVGFAYYRAHHDAAQAAKTPPA